MYRYHNCFFPRKDSIDTPYALHLPSPALGVGHLRRKEDDRKPRRLHRSPWHAGHPRQQQPRRVAARARALPPVGLSESDFAYGAVIGTVELAECAALSQELEGDPWALGPFCWRLRNARPLPDPVPTRARPVSSRSRSISPNACRLSSTRRRLHPLRLSWKKRWAIFVRRPWVPSWPVGPPTSAQPAAGCRPRGDWNSEPATRMRPRLPTASDRPGGHRAAAASHGRCGACDSPRLDRSAMHWHVAATWRPSTTPPNAALAIPMRPRNSERTIPRTACPPGQRQRTGPNACSTELRCLSPFCACRRRPCLCQIRFG